MGSDPNFPDFIGFRVIVGGGMGRTPMIGQAIREFLPWRHLLTYLEAILRVYNRHGRRDNKYKARIKILVRERGIEAFREEVEAEWEHLRDGPSTLTVEEVRRVESRFTRPAYEKPGSDPNSARKRNWGLTPIWPAPSPPGASATSIRTSSPAMPR